MITLSQYKRRYKIAKKRETKTRLMNLAFLNLSRKEWIEFLHYTRTLIKNFDK